MKVKFNTVSTVPKGTYKIFIELDDEVFSNYYSSILKVS